MPPGMHSEHRISTDSRAEGGEGGRRTAAAADFLPVSIAAEDVTVAGADHDGDCGMAGVMQIPHELVSNRASILFAPREKKKRPSRGQWA